MRSSPPRHAVILLPLLLGLCGTAMAQPAPVPPPEASAELQRLLDEARARRDLALRLAPERGWPVDLFERAGERVLLTSVTPAGLPRWYATDNSDAADTVGADELHPGGSSGLGLTGAGVTLGIWDGGGVRLTHQEFGGRAAQIDSPSGLSAHATHVAGTMVAAGVDPEAKGMSPGALIDCWDFGGDTSEMAPAASAGLRVSNHSYGFVSGWRAVVFDYGDGQGPVNTWAWYGDAAVSPEEDYSFGFYSFEAQLLDQIAYDNPRYLSVHSAGNDRDDDGPGPNGRHLFWDPATGYQLTESFDTRDPDGPWDCVSSSKTAKNILTVGSVLDVNGGWTAPGDVVQNDFSGTGPVDDGRIKPDVVANGNSLHSANSSGDADYWRASGTSMSSPNASGSIGLLLQHWRDTLGGADPLASTLKALVIHAADEAGPAPGPDYQHGWGLLDADGSATLISDAASNPLVIQELSIDPAGVVDIPFVPIDPASPVRATLVWTDPPGAPVAPALDDPTPMLVHDLDLLVHDTTGPGQFFPWSLDPAAPASPALNTGPNSVDNVEVVDFAPVAGHSYAARIRHAGGSGTQAYSLVLSNARAPVVQCSGDMNGDGTTNVFDFSTMAANFGAGPDATFEMGDLTGDGWINVFDFSEFAGDFGCEVD